MSIALSRSFRAGVGDVGEDAALGCLVHVGLVARFEQGDHGAGGFVDDLRDQLERVLGAGAETDERHVGSLLPCDLTDLRHFELARDHLVSEAGDDHRDPL